MRNPLLNYRPVEISLEIENARKKDAQIFYKRHQKDLAYRNCPICQSKTFSALAKYANSFSVRKCRQCHLVYVPEIPNEAALNEYYERYDSTRLLNDFYKSRNIQQSTISERRTDLALQALKISEKQEVTILEIGCGDGAFLENLHSKLKNAGIRAHLHGIEANCELAMTAAARHQIEIERCYFDSEYIIGRSKIDLVCCFEVIEHFTEPRKALANIFNALSPNGALVLTTPNIEGLENIAADYNDQRLIAHAICPPAHLQGFSRVTLAILATLTGFGIHSLEAKGEFDVYATDHYTRTQPTDQGWQSIFNTLERLAPEDYLENLELLQKLINKVNASSTISAVLTRNAE